MFRPAKQQPQFADLKGILAQSKDTDNALYQVVQELIERLSVLAVDKPGDPRNPNQHHETHEDGGNDEVALDATQIVSGTLNDARLSTNVQLKPVPPTTPTAHHTTHETGGTDVVDYNWVAIPYNATNFVVENGTMVWTVTAGNQSVFSYVRIGHVVIINVTILGSSFTGAALDTSVLNIKIPFTVVGNGSIATIMLEDGAGLRASGVGQAGASRIRIYRNFAAPNFPAGGINLAFQIAIQI